MNISVVAPILLWSLGFTRNRCIQTIDHSSVAVRWTVSLSADRLRVRPSGWENSHEVRHIARSSCRNGMIRLSPVHR